MISEKLLLKTYKIRYSFNALSYGLLYNAKRLKSLKNFYKDMPMIVVGNGPSLNVTPLDDYIDIPSIGMNKINLLFDKVEWRPDIIICSNRLVIQQNKTFFSKTGIPIFLSWKGRRQINKKYRRKMSFYLERPTNNFSNDITKGLGSGGGTVSYTALQFAYYLGANPVILFGIDHNFKFEGNPSSIAKAQGEDVNHFDPNYFKSGTMWGLPDMLRMEAGYERVKLFFENKQRKIYDASVGGKLNVFDKIDLKKASNILNEAMGLNKKNSIKNI